MSDTPPVQYVTVTCRVCRTRLDERLSEVPRQTTCPMCQTPVTVPSLSSAPAPPKPKRQPEVEGYNLLDPTSTESRDRARKAAESILVICPICQARLHSEARKEAYQTTCPDCHELVRIPSRSEHRVKQEKARIPKPSDPVEALPVPEPAVQRRQYSQWFLQAQAHIRREPDIRPPRSLFFTDTFTIPWQPEVLSRWMYLIVGLTTIGVVSIVLYDQYVAAAGYGGLVLAFFALPLIWITIWTVSYAAAVWLVILIDTANGNREIVNWGDQNWREWVIQLAYLEYLVAVTCVCAHGIGLLSGLAGGPYGVAFAVTAHLLFPIIALGALERGGSLNFFSANIAASLYRMPGHWLAFLMLSAVVIGGPVALLLWLIPRAMWVAIPLCGPLLATLLLVHARLLGRLAWSLGRD